MAYFGSLKYIGARASKGLHLDLGFKWCKNMILYWHLSELILRWLEEVPGIPGKSQKEGHEDQGEIKKAVSMSHGRLASLLALPWAPGNCLKPH